MHQHIRLGTSLNPDLTAAIAELHEQITMDDCALIMIFFSVSYEPQSLCTQFGRAFPHTPIVGCSTAGEIGPRGYTSNSIVAMAFSSEMFDVSLCPFYDLNKLSVKEWHDDTVKLHSEHQLNYDISSDVNTFAVLLIDGLSSREEPFTRVVSNAISGIPLVGGSAGDDLNYDKSIIYAGGEIFSDGAVLLMITSRLVFKPYKCQHVVAGKNFMVVTGAIPEKRIITEINGFPAAEEYARLSGVDPSIELNETVFAEHPSIVVIGKEQYVRSVMKVNPDKSLTFYCAIDVGIVMRTAECNGLGLVGNMKNTLEKVDSDLGGIHSLLAFDCILRKLQLSQEGEISPMEKLLCAKDVIGFSTYGEQHNGLHINQTCTGIAFGGANE